MLAKISLLIMRIGTGMLLVLWGGARLLSDGMGTKLAENTTAGSVLPAPSNWLSQLSRSLSARW